MNNPNTEKNSPYECGFEAFEDSRMKFDVRYYLVLYPVIILICCFGIEKISNRIRHSTLLISVFNTLYEIL